MAFTGSYACTNCGDEPGPDLLVAKKVMFQEIGINPRVIRSRTVAWLCPKCVANDSDWNREAYSNSPGHSGAQVKNRKAG